MAITWGQFYRKKYYMYMGQVRSRRCGCLVTWFCYQLIAKLGNKTAAPSWPDPYIPIIKICMKNCTLKLQPHPPGAGEFKNAVMKRCAVFSAMVRKQLTYPLTVHTGFSIRHDIRAFFLTRTNHRVDMLLLKHWPKNWKHEQNQPSHQK